MPLSAEGHRDESYPRTSRPVKGFGGRDLRGVVGPGTGREQGHRPYAIDRRLERRVARPFAPARAETVARAAGIIVFRERVTARAKDEVFHEDDLRIG
jgi:hypothetical protein